MAVYRKTGRNGKKAETYSYSFELGGRRFSGNTGETSERAAKRVEAREKEKAREEIKRLRETNGAPWTFGQAATAYFKERLDGEFDANTKGIFTWLQKEVGNDTPLREITTGFVAKLIARRAQDPGKKAGTRVSDATLNRTVTEPLRRILRYAAEVHDQPHGKIVWKELLRDEPKERTRELHGDEEERLFTALRADYHPIIRFCIVAGLRLDEACSLRWSDVDFGNRRVWITGKGNKRAPIPLAPSMRDILWPLRGHHAEFVFTYIAERTRTIPKIGERRIAGQRYPITYEGLKTTFRRKRETAKILDFRFHDLRHTAATRILRGSKNLKVVQTVLRHEDIATTMRYAHVLDEDVLAGIEAGVAAGSGSGAHADAPGHTTSHTTIEDEAENQRKSTG